MTRVLYSAPIFPPYDEPGSPVYYENLAEELSVDHDVHVIAPHSWSAPLIESKKGLTVYRVIPRRDRFPSPVRAILETISAFLASLFVISLRSIDLCHIQSTSYSSPGFALAATVTRTPLYYDCRDENFPRWLISWGPTKKWFSCATNIDNRLVDCGVPRKDIVRLPVVNPPYVADYAREPGLNNTDSLEVVFIGRLLKSKGVFTVAEAVARIEDEIEDISLTFIGGGSDQWKLEAKIQDMCIDENVDIRGKLSHPETLEQLSQSDVLVLPSKSEGVPRVIIEAFEIGVPVVATPVGGVPDVITHQRTGILVKDNPEEIATALIQLFENQVLAQRVARNAKDVNEQWSWEAIRKQVKTAYSALE